MTETFNFSDYDNEEWIAAVINDGPPPETYDQFLRRGSRPPVIHSIPTANNPLHKQVLCLSCQVPMVVKTNKLTREKFFGCPNYRQRHCLSATLDGVFSKGHARSYHEEDMELDFDMYHASCGDR